MLPFFTAPVSAYLSLNQYSPVPRTRTPQLDMLAARAGKEATRPVGARVARAQIYTGLSLRNKKHI